MPNSASRRTTGGSQSAFLLSMIFALLVFLNAGRTAAIAQDTQEQPSASGHHMGGRRGMPSADDQQAKLKPILEDQHKQMQQLWNDNSMSRHDRFSKIRELRENAIRKLRACSMTTSRKSSIRCAKNSAAICATA